VPALQVQSPELKPQSQQKNIYWVCLLQARYYTRC
jgi:hypothetical protein